MPVRPDAPLRRVTLNLYEEDCAHLERHTGQGWTAYVRELVHDHLRRALPKATDIPPRILGDLSDD